MKVEHNIPKPLPIPEGTVTITLSEDEVNVMHWLFGWPFVISRAIGKETNNNTIQDGLNTLIGRWYTAIGAVESLGTISGFVDARKMITVVKDAN